MRYWTSGCAAAVALAVAGAVTQAAAQDRPRPESRGARVVPDRIDQLSLVGLRNADSSLMRASLMRLRSLP